MPRLTVQRLLTLLLALALLLVAPISASAQTQKDVDAAARAKAKAEAKQSKAYAEYVAASRRLDEAIAEYEAIHQEYTELEYRLRKMDEAVTRYRDEAADIEASARQMVIDAYTDGRQTTMIGSAFAAGSIQELVTSQALVARAAEAELATLGSLEAISRQVDRSTEDLEDQKVVVQAAEEKAAVLVEEINALYEERQAILANADAALAEAIQDLREEIRKKQIEDERIKQQKAQAASKAPPRSGGADPVQTPGFICPVQGGASFSNSWGARRSGGRTHKGVDMFAQRNTPVLAVTDGRVKFSSNSIGGLSTHLYADNGVVYYYTHLQGHPTNVTSGQRVTKGTVVGFVGNSGNARTTSPHLHFEIRPGGVAVNPYPTVRLVC